LSRFWRELPNGVAVAVRVQPKSRRPGVQGTAPSADGERLRIGVSEPAEDGRANRAACTVLAAALEVAPSSVSVSADATSREKTLRVTGDATALRTRLDAL
jgi:uncharacterized protein YggU (UPF0235/DUF167 family)